LNIQDIDNVSASHTLLFYGFFSSSLQFLHCIHPEKINLCLYADALKDLGAVARSAVPTLVEILARSDNEHLRKRATAALGAIGGATESVKSALAKAMEDPDWDVRATAVKELEKIGYPSDEARNKSRPILQEIKTKKALDAVRAKEMMAIVDRELKAGATKGEAWRRAALEVHQEAD